MRILVLLTLALVATASVRAASAQAKPERLSLDLGKTGKRAEYILRWDGKNDTDANGRLRLEPAQKFKVHLADSFDVGIGPFASTISFELPGRNVLVVHQGGGGATGGETYHAFSSVHGHLYRVHLIDGGKSEPLIFTEHYSAGSPSLIKFTDSGRTVRTLTTINSLTGQRRITDYSWDGFGYRMSKSYECIEGECPAMRD